MSELLPCPFCGGEAELEKTPGGLFSVGCADWRNCFGFWTSCRYYCTEAEAIAAWNTRSERTCEFVAFIEHKLMDEPDVIELSCGHDVMVFDEGKYLNYCPNCGAKVVGE